MKMALQRLLACCAVMAFVVVTLGWSAATPARAASSESAQLGPEFGGEEGHHPGIGQGVGFGGEEGHQPRGHQVGFGGEEGHVPVPSLDQGAQPGRWMVTSDDGPGQPACGGEEGHHPGVGFEGEVEPGPDHIDRLPGLAGATLAAYESAQSDAGEAWAGEGAVGCGGVTVTGECQGEVLRWCDEGLLLIADCAETDQVCGWDAEGDGFGCLGPPAIGTSEAGLSVPGPEAAAGCHGGPGGSTPAWLALGLLLAVALRRRIARG